MNYFKAHQKDIFIFLVFLLLPWVPHFHFATHNAMIMGDNWRGAFPGYQLAVEKIRHGSSILWNEFALAGHPFLAEIGNGVLYPPKLILYLILPVKWAYNTTLLLHLSLTGFFTYLYLRCIHIGRIAAFFGGSILMFSPIYLIQEADAITLLHTITWFPLLMYLMEKRITTLQKKIPVICCAHFCDTNFCGVYSRILFTVQLLFLFIQPCVIPANITVLGRAFDRYFMTCLYLV